MNTLLTFLIAGATFLTNLGGMLAVQVDGLEPGPIVQVVGASDGTDPATRSEGIEVTVATVGEYHVVMMSDLPRSVADLDAFDLTDEYQAAAAVMCMLANFEDNFDAALEMMDVLMGPESPSAFDKSFVKEQIAQYPYVMRSYFKGATVENDYTPEVWSIAFTEGVTARQEDGYVRLTCQSSGADSARTFTLRQKGSTQEWFIFSDSYRGMMAGIRVPASADPWR